MAGNAAANASIVAKNDCKLHFEDIRVVPYVENDGEKDINCKMVVSRLTELQFIDTHTDIVLSTVNVPYGSSLYFKDGDEVKKGDLIARWDPFNAVIVTEYAGTLRFNDVIEGVTYRAETDEATGLTEKIITTRKISRRCPPAMFSTTMARLSVLTTSL